MAEIYTDKNSLLKSLTELEKDGPTFSRLFSLARACVWGDIAPLSELKKGSIRLQNNKFPLK